MCVCNFMSVFDECTLYIYIVAHVSLGALLTDETAAKRSVRAGSSRAVERRMQTCANACSIAIVDKTCEFIFCAFINRAYMRVFF